MKTFIRIWYVAIVMSASFVIQTSGQIAVPSPKADTSQPQLMQATTEFSSESSSADIDSLAIEVSKNNGSRGYMIVYCGKVCHYGEVEAHMRGITAALRYKGIDTKTIAVVPGGFKEKTTTEYWLVPANACPPGPNSSIPFREVKFRGKYKRTFIAYDCCY